MRGKISKKHRFIFRRGVGSDYNIISGIDFLSRKHGLYSKKESIVNYSYEDIEYLKVLINARIQSGSNAHPSYVLNSLYIAIYAGILMFALQEEELSMVLLIFGVAVFYFFVIAIKRSNDVREVQTLYGLIMLYLRKIK